MRRLLVVFVAVAASLGAVDGARAGTVESGVLKAETNEKPWGLTFSGPGGVTLAERRGGGSGPTGAVGFKTAVGWYHAVEVASERREGAALVSSLKTNDPLGRRIELRVAPEADGVIRVNAKVAGATTGDVQLTGIAFDASAGERYLGFGERSDKVERRGSVTQNFISDGPYQAEEAAVISAFVPPAGFNARNDATYFPIPWLLSTRGYGVLVDNPETSWFRLGSESDDAWSVEVESTELDFRVFAGPQPADVLRRYTERIGRQPEPAPYWFGPWYQPRRGDNLAELEQLLKADVPTTLAQTYTHYLPCGDQRGGLESQLKRIKDFHARGVAITTYFNPMICTTYQPVYDQAVTEQALMKNAAGSQYEYKYTGSTIFFVGQFDFTATPGRAFYGRLLKEALGHGYDGWMEDFGEYTPSDGRFADGSDGRRTHNPYVRDYHCAAYDAVKDQRTPIARFQRSGWTGTAPCAQIVWGGDPTTGWGFDGLESAIKQALSIGLSGISRWGSDIGGFFSLGGKKLEPELLIRWIQFGAASGVMRTQANGFALPSQPRPQLSDAEILPHWRRWAKLRTQLYPYIAAADAHYRRTGIPVMRHLALAYPSDTRAVAREDEYLFGPDLLVAPVVTPGARTRKAYLPKGSWVDVFRSAAYQPGDGSLKLGRAAVLPGGREHTIPAPLDELPLLARRGAVIPLLRPDVETLSDYGDGVHQKRLRDRANRIDLLAFPRGRSAATLEPGGRITSRERGNRWILSVKARRTTTFRLQASMTTLAKALVPCSVTLGGKPLATSAWSYDRKARVLRATFKTKRGRLIVAPCFARTA